jgi:hypothetical protein
MIYFTKTVILFDFLFFNFKMNLLLLSKKSLDTILARIDADALNRLATISTYVGKYKEENTFTDSLTIQTRFPRKTYQLRFNSNKKIGYIDGKPCGFSSSIMVFPGIYVDETTSKTSSYGNRVAIKLEPIKRNQVSQLSHDTMVSQQLRNSNQFGFSNVIVYAPSNKKPKDIVFNQIPVRVQVSSLLGPSLQMILCKRGPLPPSIVFSVIKQGLKRINDLHTFGYVHNDIKPSNFLLGLDETIDDNFTVYLIDFGLSKLISDIQKSNQPRPNEGTPLYMPRSVHKQTPISQQYLKDDYESLGYMFAVLLYGEEQLPWYNMIKLPWQTYYQEINTPILNEKEKFVQNPIKAMQVENSIAGQALSEYFLQLEQNENLYQNLLSSLPIKGN